MKQHIAGEIARRYAVALVEVAQERNEVVEVLEETRMLSQVALIVKPVLTSPMFEESQKTELVNMLINHLNLRPLVANTLRMIVANRRAGFLLEILKEYQSRVDDIMGVCRASLLAARPVDGELVSKIEEQVSVLMKKKVYLVPKVDESLQAGYVLKMGNTVIDASLKTQIARLRESLSRGV